MTRLSVNINKVALLRNSRRGNYPDLYAFARDCEAFGAQGITVHPRPDERHIRYADVPVLKSQVTTELNVEGYPSADFLDLVMKVKPAQCTLVPDAANVLTSENGWDIKKHKSFLTDICHALGEHGIRSALFVNPEPEQVSLAPDTGADAIELYTGKYAEAFETDREKAIALHAEAAEIAHLAGLRVHAGHDLNRRNLRFYKEHIPYLAEVSIGHAITGDALYFGIANTIQMYLSMLR
jgi:pyridoxine 5-phosphate synthase